MLMRYQPIMQRPHNRVPSLKLNNSKSGPCGFLSILHISL